MKDVWEGERRKEIQKFKQTSHEIARCDVWWSKQSDAEIVCTRLVLKTISSLCCRGFDPRLTQEQDTCEYQLGITTEPVSHTSWCLFNSAAARCVYDVLAFVHKQGYVWGLVSPMDISSEYQKMPS